MFCWHCGGDKDQPDHWRHCDAFQGWVEAKAAAAEEAQAAAPEPEPEPELPEVEPEPVEVIARPRETSVIAFYRAIDAGVIETRRTQAWWGLQALGIATTSEVFEYLKETLHLGPRYDSNTATRFTELRDLGLIREVGTRHCRVTGQLCITWIVVPQSEYAGRATIYRCPTCHQVVAREVPIRKATG